MTRFIAAWLNSWRDRPVRIASPLPPHDALQRVREGIGGLTHDDRVVAGQVYGNRLSLMARPRFVRHSSHPVLRARVVEAPGGGSELTGGSGENRLVRAVTALWLIIVAGVTLLSPFVFDGWTRLSGFSIGLGAFAFGSVVHYFMYWIGVGDERALIDWLRRRLDAAD